MEHAQRKVQDAVTDMVNTLDKQHIRKLQISMYQCSTECCKNENYRMEEVQSCLDRCSQPVQQAQALFQQELSNFQNRLQRCGMDCQDQARDQLSHNATESERAKATSRLEGCVAKCADDAVANIPSMMKRIQSMLKN